MVFRIKKDKIFDLFRYFLVRSCLIFTVLLPLQLHSDGIASVNSYVEIISSATDFRARKQSNNGQRSASSSVTNNDLSSSEVCFLELMWNF